MQSAKKFTDLDERLVKPGYNIQSGDGHFLEYARKPGIAVYEKGSYSNFGLKDRAPQTVTNSAKVSLIYPNAVPLSITIS